jgi:hypothetical protein
MRSLKPGPDDFSFAVLLAIILVVAFIASAQAPKAEAPVYRLSAEASAQYVEDERQVEELQTRVALLQKEQERLRLHQQLLLADGGVPPAERDRRATLEKGIVTLWPKPKPESKPPEK